MKQIVRTVVSLVLMMSIALTSLFVCTPDAQAASYDYATIVSAQQYLNILGYITPVTGTLDKSTQKQLKSFQRDAALTQSGEPDQKTMYRLEKRSSAAVKNNRHGNAVLRFNGDYRLLERGSNNKRVKILNEMLDFLGYEHDKGTKFGNKTYAGVCAFQNDFVRNHPVDGKAGPYTLSTMEVAYGIVYQGKYSVSGLKKYVSKHHKLPKYTPNY